MRRRARRKTNGPRHSPVQEYVVAVHLVVEQVKAERAAPSSPWHRAPVEAAEHCRESAGSRQSPRPWRPRTHPEARLLPSPGVTRLRRYYEPLQHSHRPPPHRWCRAARALAGRGFPTLPRGPSVRATPHTPVDCDRCVCPYLPRRTAAFPDVWAGRRSRLHFRGLLRIGSGFTRAHAWLLASPKEAVVS